MVRMGLWTSAELSTGIVISCLPVIPKFFQYIGPKLSSALTLRSKSRKDSGNEPASSAPSEKVRADSKLKLPSFKTAFTSVALHTEKDNEQPLPRSEYVQLHEETAIARRDATRELTQMPAAKLTNALDDLERGMF